MNKKEALDYIKLYQDNPPQPTIEYYQDPYRDGYQDASGYFVKYPPMDPKLIDAILERDKDCKEYIPDCDCDVDEKFNQEMEKKFTDLMSRAKDTVIEEYRKKNSHLYSMVTENHYNKITVIPMSLSTLCDFKEKCNRVSFEIGLKNFYVYEHKDKILENDLCVLKKVYGIDNYIKEKEHSIETGEYERENVGNVAHDGRQYGEADPSFFDTDADRKSVSAALQYG